MKNKKILISGSGISGLTLGYWLKELGFDPLIIEIAPEIKTGGYMIDFWGEGYLVAERMGLIDQLKKEQDQYKINEIDFVNKKNKKIGGFNVSKLRQIVNGRYFNLLRSGLENVLYHKVKDKVDIRFSTTIIKIEQNEESVEVTLNNGETEKYDLVIGADGFRSNTRRLIFGPDEDYELFLNYYTAAYTIENFTGKEKIFLSFTNPDKQVGIYDVGNNKLSTFYIYRSTEHYGHIHTSDKKQKLFETYKNLGWYTPELMKRMDTAPDFYLDTVSQIELPIWHKDRVAVVGDAAQSVSLISGQGSSLAMTASYVLAGELKKHNGDYEKAFSSYQSIMQPEIQIKQKSARKFASSFVPSNKFGIFIRNSVSRLMTIPLFAKSLLKSYLINTIHLEKYEDL